MTSVQIILVSSIPCLVLLSGCAVRHAEDDTQSQEQGAVTDISQMTARDDGRFDVTCKDGRHEIVLPIDVSEGRVCKPAVFPSSPFASAACIGAPMTEDDARAKLAEAPAGPKQIGKFVLAMRNRTASFTWDARSKHWNTEYTWQDAHTDALAAWDETGSSSTSGNRTAFPSRGAVELSADSSGAPYLRLTSEASRVMVSGSGQLMRFVTLPLRPWASDNTSLPRFALEEAQDAGTFGALSNSGFRIGTLSSRAGAFTPTSRSWWFVGAGVTSIVTTKCAQFVSAQSTSVLSPVDAAIGIFAVLD